MKLLPKRLTKAIKAWLDKKLLSRPHESVLRQVWAQTTRPCIIDKNTIHNEVIIPWTIMTATPQSAKYYRHRFKVVQHNFKYKFFLPLILIGSKVLGKFLIDKIESTKYNRNLVIMNESFENALNEWAWCAIRDHLKKDQDVNWFKKFRVSFTMVILRIVKRIVFTIYNDDTAYRNLCDMILFKLTIALNKEYGSKSGQHNHVLFSGKLLDNVDYYKVMGRNTERFMIPVKKGYFIINKDESLFIEHLPKDYGKENGGTEKCQKEEKK